MLKSINEVWALPSSCLSTYKLLSNCQGLPSMIPCLSASILKVTVNVFLPISKKIAILLTLQIFPLVAWPPQNTFPTKLHCCFRQNSSGMSSSSSIRCCSSSIKERCWPFLFQSFRDCMVNYLVGSTSNCLSWTNSTNTWLTSHKLARDTKRNTINLKFSHQISLASSNSASWKIPHLCLLGERGERRFLKDNMLWLWTIDSYRRSVLVIS